MEKKVNGKYEELTQGKTLGEEYRHQIKYDQAYTSCNRKQVLEVLGTHGDEETPDLEIRIWERIDEGKMKRGSILKLSELTPSCGMGCNRKMKWKDVFHKKRMERIIMDNDDYTYDTTIRRVKEVLNQNIPTTKIKCTSIWENIKDHRELIENGMIYPDGAWKDMRSAKERLFRIGGNNSKASSAVIIMSKENDWKQKEAITIRLTAETENVKEQLTKAFTMEAIAILAAAQIVEWFKTDVEITMDCRGVLDKLNYAYVESWANHGQIQILSTIHNIYKKKIN